jgi:Rrf2 family protein
MIHFNRKTEYAILSIEHMARKEGAAASTGVTSTREIADAYHIPYPLLAKVLQKLATKGMIRAVHGTKGGYILAKKAAEISIADVVEIFDGPVAVVECLNEERITCPQWDGCHIKDPFSELNSKIHNLLVQTKIADLTARHSQANAPKELTIT